MKSTAEELISPVTAAEQALALLEQMAPGVSAVVWGASSTGWCRMASLAAAADEFPVPGGAESQPVDLHDQGMLELSSAGETLGWLAWRGVARASAQAVTCMLTAQWVAVRLAEQQSRARVVHETLLEINQLATECHGVESFFTQAHHLLSRLTDAENFYIALCEEDTGSVRFPFYRNTQSGFSPAVDQIFSLKDAGQLSLLARVIHRGETQLLGQQALRSPLEDREPLPICWIGAPLIGSTGRVSGAVVLQRYPQQATLSAVDRRVFQLAAHHIGAALDRLLYHSQLEKQVWIRTCELEGVNARLRAEASERQRAEKFQTALFHIAELANASLSLGSFLAGLHRLLSELMQAKNCLVALYDSDSDLIRYPYCIDEQVAQMKPHRPGKGPIEQVLHSGRPLLLNVRQPADVGLESSAHSWLGVPLYCSHELMGVLAVQSYQSGIDYSYRDQELLEYVANNIGTSLARVRALEELQLANNQLEQRVRERTSELDAVNAQLQFDSTHDPLTQLPNRSYFSQTLRRTWDAYLNGSGERFSVFFIDLDRFKLVNDTLGHLAGDHLLFEAGARIRSCLRHYDFMARLGGDEFAVLLFGMDQIEGCEQIARRMVSEFERPIILAGREVFTTASVGVVMADREYYHKADDLLRDADHAMYCTKQQGRHGYTLFNHELRINQADQLAMEAELRRALDECGQLIPYYQPFIDSRSGALVGFETLVRWQHPTRGLILPSLFLPIAEESRLIMRLDRYMINASCAQLRQWQDQGLVGPDIALHINLSSANFHDPELVGWMAQVIERYQLPAHILHLEITESALIDVPDIAVTVMHALQKLGIRLALDDFGTGYSALSYLHRYHFDVLKIDQSFVFDVDRKEESAAIVRAILALASALSLDVVAEGVETIEQLVHLREMGCAKLQGFYFAPPLPAEYVNWQRLASFREELRGVD